TLAGTGAPIKIDPRARARPQHGVFLEPRARSTSADGASRERAMPVNDSLLRERERAHRGDARARMTAKPRLAVARVLADVGKWALREERGALLDFPLRFRAREASSSRALVRAAWLV